MVFWLVVREGLSVGAVSPLCKGHRYPVEVVSRRVGLCFRFPLSFREAGDLTPERGIAVSGETVCRWCVTFGQWYAGALHSRAAHRTVSTPRNRVHHAPAHRQPPPHPTT